MDTRKDKNFQFQAGNSFWTNLTQKIKFLVSAKIWYSDQFEYAEYAEFNGDIHFFYF